MFLPFNKQQTVNESCYCDFVSFAQHCLWASILLSTFRYKKILEEILKAGGNELVDNIKAFVEACK